MKLNKHINDPLPIIDFPDREFSFCLEMETGMGAAMEADEPVGLTTPRKIQLARLILFLLCPTLYSFVCILLTVLHYYIGHDTFHQ